MKIRTVKPSKEFDWEPEKENQHFSEIYEVTTITPIFGGGVDAGSADMDMPIRASAIRGQLRFWWRFLQSNRVKGDKLEGMPLYQAEREIWGGLNNDIVPSEDKDYDAAGKVRLAVVVKKNSEDVDADTLVAGKNLGIKYALFSAEDNLLSEGIEFTLKLNASKQSDDTSTTLNHRGLSESQWHSVIEAVRWWANFGGIGARTRRGLGAVSVEGIAALSHYEVEDYGCELKARGSKRSAIDAWNDAVTRLFNFRQKPGLGREIGKGSRPGRSYWPEPDTIRELTKREGHTIEHEARRSFPRAMFGLPIIFEIRGRIEDGEPPKTHLLPDKSGTSRMASPLIIKPVADGDGGYYAAVLRLPVEHLTDLKLKLEIDRNKKEKEKLIRDRNCAGVIQQFPFKFSRNDGNTDSWWPVNTTGQETKASHTKPMHKRSHDPLEAFLKYFTELGS